MNIVISFLVILYPTSILCTFSREEEYMKIYYYSQLNPSGGILVDLSNTTQVAYTPFSNEKETLFYIHGWADEVVPLFSTGQLLKFMLLERHDINVFLIDWTDVKKHLLLYALVVQKVDDLGNKLGSLIWDLVENMALNPRTTTIVGNSVGAHIAGVAGRALNGEIEQIVGIDPAGPWFHSEVTSNRLTDSSAKFVQGIHASGGSMGYFPPVGHADYYVNGGMEQELCKADTSGKCVDIIALIFYIESLFNGNFVARKCNDYETFKRGDCDAAEMSWMGGYYLDKRARGTYYLDTNSYPPFAKYHY